MTSPKNSSEKEPFLNILDFSSLKDLKSPGSWYNYCAKMLAGTASSNSILSLADQVVVSATNFLTGIIIARFCTKEELGIYMLGFSIVLLVHDLQNSLISSPYLVYSQQLKGEAHKEFTGSTLAHQILLSLLALLTLLVISTVISNGFGSADLRTTINSLCIVIPFIMTRELIRRICFANLKMSTAFIVDFAVGFLQLGSLLILAYLDMLTSHTAFTFIGIACGITMLGWLISERDSYSFNHDSFWKDFKKNLSFGKWTLASSLSWTLGMAVYPWLLAYYHGTASTGVWAACWGITAIANPLLLGMQNILGPKIVQSFTNNSMIVFRHFVMKVSLISLLIITPLAITLFFFGDQFVILFYGKKYAGNGSIISVLSVNLLIITATFTISRALLAMEKVKLYFMANIIPLIIILSLGVLLVRNLGAIGVAWGVLLGYVTTASTMTYLFFHLIRKSMMLEARYE